MLFHIIDGILLYFQVEVGRKTAFKDHSAMWKPVIFCYNVFFNVLVTALWSNDPIKNACRH